MKSGELNLVVLQTGAIAHLADIYCLNRDPLSAERVSFISVDRHRSTPLRQRSITHRIR